VEKTRSWPASARVRSARGSGGSVSRAHHPRHDVAVDLGVRVEQAEATLRIRPVGGAPGLLVHAGGDDDQLSTREGVVPADVHVHGGREGGAVAHVEGDCARPSGVPVDQDQIAADAPLDQCQARRGADSADPDHAHPRVTRSCPVGAGPERLGSHRLKGSGGRCTRTNAPAALVSSPSAQGSSLSDSRVPVRGSSVRRRARGAVGPRARPRAPAAARPGGQDGRSGLLGRRPPATSSACRWRPCSASVDGTGLAAAVCRAVRQPSPVAAGLGASQPHPADVADLVVHRSQP
jgi:hypothetical protein